MLNTQKLLNQIKSRVITIINAASVPFRRSDKCNRVLIFFYILTKELLSDQLCLSDLKKKNTRRRHRLKGIQSLSDTSRTGAEGLSFYCPRLLHCLDQILAVMLLSQHRVSSSKTVRPRSPCGARCIRHAVSTWSAVCSKAPHSQFDEGARPHLCMDE